MSTSTLPAQVEHTRDRARLQWSRPALTEQLRALPRPRARRAHASARRLIGLLGDFTAAGVTPLRATLGLASAEAWEQYAHAQSTLQKAGDLFFYYHCHERALHGEHGHFHLFIALDADAKGNAKRHAHLVGIGVDARGLPQRLFTTNRWVTDESWIDAARASRALERILARQRPDVSALEQWLRNLLAVFQPQIESLLRHRDQRLARRARAGILEDRRLYILSECKVSLVDQMVALDAASH